MSRTVTELKNRTNDPGQVEVYLDGLPAFSVKLLDAARLKVGQRLNPKEIEALTARDTLRTSYRHAIRFLGTRSRSCKEVEQHLHRKEIPAMAIRETIAKLVEQNYLDDREFAISWVRQRERLKPRSHRVLRQELIQKGIRVDWIDNALEMVDEYEMARKSVRRRMKSWAAIDRKMLKDKVLRYLHNNGYPYDIAGKAFRYLCGELDESHIRQEVSEKRVSEAKAAMEE